MLNKNNKTNNSFDQIYLVLVEQKNLQKTKLIDRTSYLSN